MQYQQIEVPFNGRHYSGTVTRLPPAFIPGKPANGNRYLFIFENWDGTGPGMLIIEKSDNHYKPHESSPIMDKAVAFAAGETLKALL